MTTTKKPRKQSTPGAGVKIAKDRLLHLVKLSERVRSMCAHWDPALDREIGQAQSGLTAAATLLANQPDGWVPPRKTRTMSYSELKVGDKVRIADRYKERSPESVRDATMVVESLSGNYIYCAHGGKATGLERRFLRVVK